MPLWCYSYNPGGDLPQESAFTETSLNKIIAGMWVGSFGVPSNIQLFSVLDDNNLY